MSEVSEQSEDLFLNQIEINHFLYCHCGGSLLCVEEVIIDHLNQNVEEGEDNET